MRTALVTGAAGLVGRHMCAALAAAGWWVTGVDVAPGPDNGTMRNWTHGGVDCREVFKANETYELIAHCAATVGGREMIEGAPLTIAANLGLDAAMFAWAARTKPEHVIYFSSSAAYPVALQRDRGHRLAEDDIDLTDVHLPDEVYGWAKLTGEMLAAKARAAGVNVHVLRPFSGYASDQSSSYPFPAFLARAIAHDDPFLIWGSGEQTRDWVHMDDVVATALEMVRRNHPGPLNVGHGVATTFAQLAGLMAREVGYRPGLERRRDAPVGVQHRVCNPSRLHALRRPEITLLTGIRRCLAELAAPATAAR